MNNEELLDTLEGNEIAVVGMAARVPGAENVDMYWQNLLDGVESATHYTDGELRAAGVSEATLQNPHYIKSGAPLEGMEEFDANFFGFSPRDAAIMDPQHRHFIECAWEAMEHAGYDPARYDGSVGVFGGSGHNIYMAYNLLTNPGLMDSVGFFLVRHTSNDKDFLVTRVSYLFNLKGPAVNVQTACSTSLVAIHMGVQSLLNGESDMIMAGGVTIELPHHQGYMYEEGEILSPDGHCRAFDVDSQGTRFGSGVGVVVLKRLEDAIADGDTVHAVILGSAINNDGSGKVNYLAPSVDGQAEAIGEAIELAGVEAETITYIEAHGTGTEIGDPIEVAALTQAFRHHTEATQFCGIGSVKTNIGHLDTAAGVASFIKVTKALKHGVIPASLNYTAPNPRIDFASSPFYVNGAQKVWETDGFPRRAGVSSLGVGGTNAHIILEEPPQMEASDGARPVNLLLLSAKNDSALNEATANLAAYLRHNPDANLSDVAYTLQVGRNEMERRRLVVVNGVEDAVEALEGLNPKRVLTGTVKPSERQAVFMFTGQGSQYVNMGRDLYETEVVFQEAVDECVRLLRPKLGLDLLGVMYPPAGAEAPATEQLKQTALTQPALFAIEYATAQLWLSWGIKPSGMIGHSIGEYVAACLAGVMSLADALAIVAERGRLMQACEPGSMLIVPLPEAQVKPYLNKDVSLATINGPALCVVAGPDGAIDKLQARLEGQEVLVRRLRTSHAFHSAMMEPALAPFVAAVRKVRLSAPEIPYVSNVTGQWITPQEATNPEYYAQHIRGAVRFSDGLLTLLERDSEVVLIEVGPGRTLTTFARQHEQAGKAIVNSLRHPKDGANDQHFMLGALGQVWFGGVRPDWAAFYGDALRYRIPLPTYPFQHQRYWVEPGVQQFAEGATSAVSMAKKGDVADWFYAPTWTAVRLPQGQGDAPGRTLVFANSDELGNLGKLGGEIVAGLPGRVTTVRQGEGFAEVEGGFVVNPGRAKDFTALVGALQERGELPESVVYLWTTGSETVNNQQLTKNEKRDATLDTLDTTFNSLLFLIQAIGNEVEGLDLTVVTDGLQQVAGEAVLHPQKALALGVVRVVGQEYPHILARSVDVGGSLNGWQRRAVVKQVVGEVVARPGDQTVAYRGTTRWVQGFAPAPLDEMVAVDRRVKTGGVYLITGGMGGIGLEMAGHLAGTAGAKLVLVSRSALPGRETWDSYLASHSEQDKISQRISKVRGLEVAGAEVLAVGANVADLSEMQAVVAQAKARFGQIDGVIHAAGTLNDGLMQMKTAEEARGVILPKVQGALVLDEVLGDEVLDFMVLFSSVSVMAGPAGQVDYTAANAFLDAFAHYRTARDGSFTVAVNWGAWQEVGMAVQAAINLGLIEPDPQEVDYPFWDKRLDKQDETVYATDFSIAKHWLLSEHRLKAGNALIPGTGFLELTRAAWTNKLVDSGQWVVAGEIPVNNAQLPATIELREVFFMAPFMMGDGEEKELRITFSGEGEFLMTSNGSGLKQEHVRGQAGVRPAKADERLNLDVIRRRCQLSEEVFEKNDPPYLAFGPRWQNLRKVQYGRREALITLEMPTEYAADLAQHTLHPSLLDMATAGAQALSKADFDPAVDFYVPFSYGRLRQYRPLSERVFSYVRYRPGKDPETNIYDVTIADETGLVLVDIDGFVMRRVDSSVLNAAQPTMPQQREKRVDPFLETLQAGIDPAGGLSALDRVLSGAILPQVVVVSQDLQGIIQQAKQGSGDEGGGDEGGAGMAFDRPELATPYVAPETPLQTKIAGIWQEMLGITTVGVQDDFFELGGHSLLLTQVITRVRKLSKADIPLFSLFEASTITELAVEIEKAEEDATPGEEAPTLARISRDKYRVARKALKVKKKKKKR